MQPWFNPYAIPDGGDGETRRSFQGTCVFCVSMFQYMTLAIVYSKGIPYRKPLFNNWMLCTSLVVLSIISAVVVLKPPEFMVEFLEFDPIPYFSYRLFLLMLAFLSGITSYIYEKWFIDYLISGVRERWRKKRRIEADSSDAAQFERILRTIGGDPGWLRGSIAITSTSAARPWNAANGTATTSTASTAVRTPTPPETLCSDQSDRGSDGGRSPRRESAVVSRL